MQLVQVIILCEFGCKIRRYFVDKADNKRRNEGKIVEVEHAEH